MGTTGGASDGEAAVTSTYATLAQLRLVSHFMKADISDSDVNSLIYDADRAILRLATNEVYNEELAGDIDGSNKIFTTMHKPIADIDFDKDVDKDDVTVYLVDYDSEQNPFATETEVDTVNARDGIVTLTTAPTTSNAEAGVYIDYRYYKGPVDYDMLTLAANYYLAHLCEMSTPNLPRGVRGARSGPSAIRSRWISLALSQLSFAKPSMKVV
jgi:hypothetical protein